MDGIDFLWRGVFENEEVNALHADAFDHGPLGDDWLRMVDRHSLGWVTARDEEGLVGFVNLPWDGGVHAWIQDTMVASRRRRQGVGRRLVEIAMVQARYAGCEWLHVDFDDELGPFYYGACGFKETSAGLIGL